MARARNLKPGFFKDAKIVGCSFEARLLFQGLWCMADYKGRLKYVPLEMKMEVFPADNVDVEKCCNELKESGLISIYQDRSGSTLVQVQNFEKHQNPHINERKDKAGNWMPALPGPEDCKRTDPENEGKKETTEQRVKEAIRVLQEYSESDPADSLLLIPDSLFPSKEHVPPSGDTYPPEFEEIWKLKPKREGGNPKNQAYGAYKASLKRGATVEEIKAGVIRYKEYCDRKGLTNTDKVQQMRTFFGKGEGFREEWTVTQETVRYEQNRGAGYSGQPTVSYDPNDTSWADDFNPNGGDFDGLS